ncbi:poly polymerase catalytic domain-containing protein [Mycena belliarum]|uniref:Poly [ADP-ribose] polymerase n=1 Tax=Mycena belliarum TaxID=1033014 RepID=A0AAD6UGC4_9AGAR|nr:poly polymerase catalytic domain-containing protein [Mycena belliae]
MPPRKKAADGAPAAPTRASTRTKATPADAPAATASKPKSKRARDASDSEDDAPAAKKPPSKKAKKAPASKKKAADDDEDDDDPPPAKKPASKRTKKAPVSKKMVDDDDDEEDDDAAPAKKPASKRAKKAPVSKKKADDDDEDDDDAAPAAPAKMVTVLKRGRAPVDSGSGKVNTHQVYCNAEGVWDAMLNQTNIGENNNKFYVLQLLHPIGNDSQCVLFTRWGRVGADGQTQLKGPWAASTAVLEFKKQFKAKAATNWEDRVGMVAKKGKYTWLERDYGDEDDNEDEEMPASGSNSKKKEKEAPIPDSTLEPEVQELCRLIFSTTIIDATLSSMNYDANKLPLGKLAKSTILKGFAALKTLSEVIANPNCDAAQEYNTVAQACEQLSSAYYSIIPHDFGRNRPISINNENLLKRELDLVDALGDMEIASKLIAANKHADADGNPVNPLDANFLSLGLSSMAPVKRTSDEFKVLETYVRDTHGHTHSHIKASVLNAYRVERAGETDAWKKAGYHNMADGERLLLWHGSRSTNFAGILKQGLRIAPPEAPVTGYMFGKGVYFADMMSKSAGYCYPGLSNNIGLLLLCEVAAKPFYELVTAEYNADKGCKSNKKKATKGLGQTQPGKWMDAGKALGNDELVGCHMPDGPGQDTPIPSGGYLQYNEYIVYDASQIRLKYLLMVQM